MSDTDITYDRHIGNHLRILREDMSLSARDVAEELNVQVDYIIGIEELDTDSLPSIGYVLGYVRAYAGLVGLDGSEAVSRYKHDSSIPQNLGLRNQPHFVPQRHIRIPKGVFAATTVMSCFAVLAFWYGSNTGAESSALVELPVETAIPTATDQTITSDDNFLTLKAVAPSWIEIKDEDGQVILSRILVPGDIWQTERTKFVSLSARDAGALEIYIGSDSYGLIGKKGEPVFDQILSGQ